MVFNSRPGSRHGPDVDNHVTSGGPLEAYGPQFPLVQAGDVDGARLTDRLALGVVAVRSVLCC